MGFANQETALDIVMECLVAERIESSRKFGLRAGQANATEAQRLLRRIVSGVTAT